MLRLQHLAAELERILPGGMGELVDEAFAVDRVVVDVDAAPEARAGYAGCASHGRSARSGCRSRTRASGPPGLRPWNTAGSMPSFRFCGKTAAEDRLPGNAHLPADELAGRIQPAAQFALRHRVIDSHASCPLRASTGA